MNKEEDVLTAEDFEDVLNYHRRKKTMERTESEHLCGTINYALDKLLSKLVESTREEEG